MKKLLTGVLCAMTLLSAACNDDKETEKTPDFEQWFSAITVTVSPEVLEAIGGKVPVTVTLTVPPKAMWTTAEVTVTPVLKWNAGQSEGQAFGFQGEETPDIGGTVIPYETGGKAVGKCGFDFIPQMAKSELMLEFALTYGKYKESFSVKAADGVIASYQ